MLSHVYCLFLECQLGALPSLNNAHVSWEKHATCVLCGLPVSCSQWFSGQVWLVSFSVSPPVYLDTSSWVSFVMLFCFETFIKLTKVSVPFFVHPWHLGVLNKDLNLYLSPLHTCLPVLFWTLMPRFVHEPPQQQWLPMWGATESCHQRTPAVCRIDYVASVNPPPIASLARPDSNSTVIQRHCRQKTRASKI